VQLDDFENVKKADTGSLFAKLQEQLPPAITDPRSMKIRLEFEVFSKILGIQAISYRN